MPHHNVARQDIDETIAEIEKTEEIVDVVAAGDGAFDVFTRPKPKIGRPRNVSKDLENRAVISPTPVSPARPTGGRS